MSVSRGFVLITGARGQMGTLLSSVLTERGYQVLGISRGWDKKQSVGKIDLSDVFSLSKLLNRYRPVAIFHLAAVQGPSGSLQNLSTETAAQTYLVQNKFLETIGQAVINANFSTKIIVAGSSKVFSAGSPQKIVDWDSELDLSTHYARSKNQARMQVQEFRTLLGLDAIYGLVFNNDSEIRGRGYLLREIARQVTLGASNKQRTIINVNNADTLIDWSASIDFAHAYANLLEFDWSDDFILASSESISVREIAMRASALAKKKTEILSEGHSPGDAVIARRNDLMKLGINSKTSIEDVLREILRQEFGLSPSPNEVSNRHQRQVLKISLSERNI